MNLEDLKAYIEAGKESRHLEYKRSCSWDDVDFKAAITKSVLGMSNIPDGGTIIIAMEKQHDNSYLPRGVQSDHLETFKNEDYIKAHISNFADPYADFSVELGEYNDNKFVLIIVREFAELPVICKSDGAKNLKKGAIYTRTRRHPETSEVPSQTELREILDSAIDKGMRRLTKRGYVIEGQKAPKELFEEQLGDFR